MNWRAALRQRPSGFSPSICSGAAEAPAGRADAFVVDADRVMRLTVLLCSMS